MYKSFAKLKKYLVRNSVKTYSLSEVVKEISGYPKWLPLPFNIHHGWYTDIKPRKKDLKQKTYPLMLVWNKRQEIIWKEYSSIDVVAIGAPFIHYRRKNNIQINSSASGTIAFPAHSAKSSKASFDTNEYCNYLKSLPISYKPITICLHHYDLLLGTNNIYEEHGFKVVSAGHVHSPKFVDNLFEILSSHKYSTSNLIGTYVLYSVEMGIPFILYGNRDKSYKVGNSLIGNESVKPLAEELFSYDSEEIKEGIKITQAQQKFVIDESGMNDCVDMRELKHIMLKAFFFKLLPKAVQRFVTLPVLLVRKLITGKKVSRK
jgi:hypothetical protein